MAAPRPAVADGRPTIHVDGETLLPESLLQLGSGKFRINLTAEAWERVRRSRDVIEHTLQAGEVAYGINTGFGLFSKVVIGPKKLRVLQENLIRSHAAGVGKPLSRRKTRALLALRINVLSKGLSGISPETLRRVVDLFNADCLSVVPEKGTVGASGDLAPLSHLALGLMGEGPMWNPRDGSIGEARQIVAEQGVLPIQLQAKEGLAMINGTQLITSIGVEACVRAQNVLVCADITVAMTLEALKGTCKAYHPSVHAARPHRGQNLVATRLRKLLRPTQPSEIYQNHQYSGRVQDAYTLRCAPQVHGVVNDTVDFVKGILTTEMNSATDNPMVFAGGAVENSWLVGDGGAVSEGPAGAGAAAAEAVAAAKATPESPVDAIEDLDSAKREIARLRQQLKGKKRGADGYSMYKTQSDLAYNSGGGTIISGGNFHGEYPAKVLDFLAIAVSEIGSISERRIERLCNPQLSELPAFLVQEGGINSGFMIAHCTAAALVSENKVLVHPASCDSISTSAAKEDHVSMGGFAARKALTVVEHVEIVIAIELLCACQAIEFFRPLRTSEPLEAVHRIIRSRVPAWDVDRHMSPAIDACVELIRSGAIAQAAQPFLDASEPPASRL